LYNFYKFDLEASSYLIATVTMAVRVVGLKHGLVLHIPLVSST